MESLVPRPQKNKCLHELLECQHNFKEFIHCGICQVHRIRMEDLKTIAS
jgi:hypothetical protein